MIGRIHGMTVPIGRYAVFSGREGELVEQVIDGLADTGPARTLACLNPHSYVVATEDSSFQDALLASDWLLPDGAGILWASRRLGAGLTRRVSGPDMFLSINAAANRRGGTRVFLVGGPKATVDVVGEKLKTDFPALEIVGCFAPRITSEFNDADVAQIAKAANAARADILWLGLGAPKQEKLAHKLATVVEAGFIGSVGAAFDFYSGRVQRSSPRMQALGLEWLPRLLQNPSRLWRRTFVSAPIFVAHIVSLGMTAPRPRTTLDHG